MGVGLFLLAGKLSGQPLADQKQVACDVERILYRKGNHLVLGQSFAGENLDPLTYACVRILEMAEDV